MASNLLPKDKKILEEIAASAEAYPLDSDEMNTLDGDGDPLRMIATIAREMLDKDKQNES